MCVCDYCRTPFLCFVFIVNAVCAVILCFFEGEEAKLNDSGEEVCASTNY